jgi:hypothetical protein
MAKSDDTARTPCVHPLPFFMALTATPLAWRRADRGT